MRNHSNVPIHLLLGYGHEGGHNCLAAITLRLASANGKMLEVFPKGVAVSQKVRIFNKVLGPNQHLTAMLHLKEIREVENTNPADTSGQHEEIRSGRYKIRALFRGEAMDLPPDALPYWIGNILSNPVTYDVH